MLPIRRLLFLLSLLPFSFFLLWLVAVWPPPFWYRTHWPAETEFMRLRAPRGANTLLSRTARRDGAGDGRGGRDGGGCAILDSSRDRLARGADGAGVPAGRIRLGIASGPWRAVAGAGERPGTEAGDPRGEHDHPAGRQEPVPVAVAESAPEAEGGGDGLPARARSPQAPDPRALPQCGRAGRRSVGSGGRRAGATTGRPRAGSPMPRPPRWPPPCRFPSAPTPPTGRSGCGGGRT